MSWDLSPEAADFRQRDGWCLRTGHVGADAGILGWRVMTPDSMAVGKIEAGTVGEAGDVIIHVCASVDVTAENNCPSAASVEYIPTCCELTNRRGKAGRPQLVQQMIGITATD